MRGSRGLGGDAIAVGGAGRDEATSADRGAGSRAPCRGAARDGDPAAVSGLLRAFALPGVAATGKQARRGVMEVPTERDARRHRHLANAGGKP